MFFFKINLVLAQEKINLQELQPTFEEELDSLESDQNQEIAKETEKPEENFAEEKKQETEQELKEEIKEPTPEVATCPVNGTPIPTINDPTPDVTDCPVGDITI